MTRPMTIARRGLLSIPAVAIVQPDAAPNLVGWWKADALSGADADPVVSWADSSGLSHTLVQATSGKRPTLRTNVLNGRQIVRFDGTDDIMTAAFTLAQTVHILAVAKWRSQPAGNLYLFDGNTANTLAVYQAGATGVLGMYAGTVLTTVATGITANWHALSLLFAGASSASRVDGTVTASGNAGSASPGGVSIGASPNGTSPAPVDVAEVCVYSAALSAGDRTGIEAYLRAKWGTP